MDFNFASFIRWELVIYSKLLLTFQCKVVSILVVDQFQICFYFNGVIGFKFSISVYPAVRYRMYLPHLLVVNLVEDFFTC